jgi:hypothetical protein
MYHPYYLLNYVTGDYAENIYLKEELRKSLSVSAALEAFWKKILYGTNRINPWALARLPGLV